MEGAFAMTFVRRSLTFSIMDKYVSQVLVICTTMVMARILTPAETGLYLVASAVILLADNFRAFGVNVYIVQAPDLDRAMIQSAFTVTLILSITMGGAIYLGTGQIASFYGKPELKHLLIVAALGFLVVPFASPIMALLQRDLAFKALAGLNIAAALTNAVVTIGMGVAGLGPASYMWGYVISSAVLALLAFAVRPEPWIFRPSFVDVRRLLSFGLYSSSVTVANMAYDLLPRLALGKILGFDAVGLYSRAVTICQLPDRAIASAIQPVILPAMAVHARAGGDLKEAYLRGHMLMSAVQWPALIMVALLADPLVRILLGPQWGEVPPLVRLIALASMALAPAFMTFPLLVAIGRIRDALLSSTISLPPSVLIVVSAAPLGLEAVAASLFLVAPLQMLVALFFVRRAIGLKWEEMALASRTSLVFALGTALIPGLVVAFSPTGFALGWVQTAVAVIGGATGWLAVCWLVEHPIKDEIVGVWRLLIDRMLPRRILPVAGAVATGPERR
jgi:O-antigen/teichoic acid export membrane protein